jgi:hypothetical protein
MKWTAAAILAGILATFVVFLIGKALGVPLFWTGYYCGIVAAILILAILTRNNRHKAKSFDSYHQYQEWVDRAKKRIDIEIVAVTDFNGHVIVTYIVEE